MSVLRRLLAAHRGIAVWLLVAALAMKLIVPAGMMLSTETGAFGIRICSGFGPMAATAAADAERMLAERMPTKSATPSHGEAATPCDYLSLGGPGLAAVDPVLLLIALAIVFAGAIHLAARPPAPAAPHLRPYLRGPPATA